MASSSKSMMQCTFEALRSENRRLRNLVVSLSATVLRNVAVNFAEQSRREQDHAEQFVREAEVASLREYPGLKTEIADGLEVAGYELPAKVVEIERHGSA